MAFQLINPTAETLRFLDEWNGDAPFVEAHTSGSTGTPKAVRLLKEDMLVSAQATNSRFGIGPDSTLLCPLSADYIAGKMMIVRAISAQCTLIAEKPSNSPIQGEYGTVDLAALVPSQCISLISRPHNSCRLRNVIVGGAPLSTETEKALACMPWHTFATYGMTETCSHVALRPMGSNIYTAMPGITFDTDSRGCLVIDAPAFSFGHLITNDAVELVTPKSFRWLGRHDNVINSGGVKFYPDQLEKMLEGHLGLPFYIKGMSHSRWGEAVALVAELPDGADRTAAREKILAECRAWLPRYAVPAEIFFVNTLPRTSTGKIKRL